VSDLALTRPAAPVADAVIMIGRALRLTRRNVDTLMIALALPIMLMLLFVYLFGGAIQTGTAYVTYVVPGVMMLCAGYGSSLTAVSVATDMTSGVMDRFRSMDVRGAAVLAGHVLASAARNMFSMLLVVAVAFLIGFRPSADALDWVLATGVLLLFVLAMSWVSAVIGVLVSNPEAASGFTFFVLFLPYPSSALVPIDTMPSWIQGFAEFQICTPVIETLRSLMHGTPIGDNGWLALVWCGGVLAVSVVLSGVLFRRKT
jgi:ABC-2 type transport system permease protein